MQTGANPKTLSQFGLQAATRLYEVGIASNRRSACYGEIQNGSCTNRPSNSENLFDLKLIKIYIFDFILKIVFSVIIR